MNLNTELAEPLFSKEFPANHEIEWKLNLATMYPAGFIYSTYNEMEAEDSSFSPFTVSRYMGRQPLGIQYFNLLCHYYGHVNETGVWVEDFVIAQPPETDLYLPRIKTETQKQSDLRNALGNNAPKIRKEKKYGVRDALRASQLGLFIAQYEQQNDIEVCKLGILQREKYSFYVTNQDSQRNWSLSADICHQSDTTLLNRLSQIELEYKGRNGLHLGLEMLQYEAIAEANELLGLISSNLGDEKVEATSLTKFDWFINKLGYENS